MYFEKIAIVLATSFGGSYMVGWGVESFVLGVGKSSLNPLLLFSGSGCSGNLRCYLLLGGILVGGLVGTTVQWFFTSHYEDCCCSKEKDPELSYSEVNMPMTAGGQ